MEVAENKRFICKFGRFVLDPPEKTLFADGVPVHLPAREFETPLLFVENSGRALSREEMLTAIWQDVFVKEENLAKQISRLRKILNTKDVLALRIDNRDYEKTLLGQTNFERAVPEELRQQAKLAVKNEYLFDFLDLGDEFSERELEREIVSKTEKFLHEMGGMFAFIGSQYRLEVEGEEFFIDLLFFHRVLRSLVASELKIGSFEPEFVGKMQFYLTALDETVRPADENPSIGLILCRTKTKTIVEYALRTANAPVGVAQYRIVSELPAEYVGQLPVPEETADLLSVID